MLSPIRLHLCGCMEPCNLLIDKECVRNPNLFDIICTHNQLIHIRLKYLFMNLNLLLYTATK